MSGRASIHARSNADFRGSKGQRTSAYASLTPREQELVELFAKGITYGEVATLLGLSVNTIRSHVRNLYEKLHVCSKAEAVARETVGTEG